MSHNVDFTTEQKVDTLLKAINLAVDRDWPAVNLGGSEEWKALPETEKLHHVRNMIVMGMKVESQSYPITLFNHGFAQKLWPGPHEFHEETCIKCKMDRSYYTYEIDAEDCWQHNLHQLVLAEDRIKYLETLLWTQHH